MSHNKLNTAIFIERATKIHNYKYDYSKSVYVNTDICLEIICPIHGTFLQRPSVHFKGGGCPKCGKEKLGDMYRYSKKDFIAKSILKHNNKYDYSKANYIDAKNKVEIICPIHNKSFYQRPSKHIFGDGCKECNKLTNKTKLIGIDNFINRANIIHNNMYDYSKSVYNKSYIFIDIICKEHGLFSLAPSNHLAGRGCPKCGILIRSNKLRKTTDTFISKSVEIHFDRYEYSKVEYINTNTKVIINCSIHGDFCQTPAAHLKGQGCPKCGDTVRAINQTKNTEWFIDNAIKIHGNKYDYSKSVYVSARNKIDVICNRHGLFKMQPTNHINLKQGCPKCYMSKGESAIYSFFNQIDLPIETQKMFKDCKIHRMLPFDFYVPKFNTLIEYDGEFHYMPIHKLGGEKSFKKTKETDRIKNEFVKANNIKLIRIPYWEFDNIENILKKELCI